VQLIATVVPNLLYLARPFVILQHSTTSVCSLSYMQIENTSITGMCYIYLFISCNRTSF